MPKLSNSCRLPYQIYNEDCFETFKRIPNESIDLVLCDPPYGTTACKWDSIIPLEPMWKELKRVIKSSAGIVMTSTQPFTSVLGVSNLKHLKYDWTWYKSRATGHLNAKKMPMKNKEDILVFYKDLPTFNPQGLVDVDREIWNSVSDSQRGKSKPPTSTVTGGIRHEAYHQNKSNYPRQVLHFKSEGKIVHPTQKPVALMEYLIKTYSNEGDTVLDFAMGSGTTGVACMNLGRKFIGCDKEHGYFEIAKNRISEAYRMKVGQNA